MQNNSPENRKLTLPTKMHKGKVESSLVEPDLVPQVREYWRGLFDSKIIDLHDFVVITALIDNQLDDNNLV